MYDESPSVTLGHPSPFDPPPQHSIFYKLSSVVVGHPTQTLLIVHVCMESNALWRMITMCMVGTGPPGRAQRWRTRAVCST